MDIPIIRWLTLNAPHPTPSRLRERGYQLTQAMLYIASEVVASDFGVEEAGAERPEHTPQYVRSASTARLRPEAAQ